MKFIETEIKDAYILQPEPKGDERGSFSRLFCSEEFQTNGIDPAILQINHSHSTMEGTIRGLHFQIPPKEERKIVKCIYGSIYDVIVDLRPDSPTFGEYFGAKLTQENRLMMVVPNGCAHGFYTLSPDCEIIYFVSENYSPEHERGIRWDDPFLSIDWPGAPLVISEKDKNHPNFDVVKHKEMYAALV